MKHPEALNFEAAIASGCKMYQGQGLAFIEKVPTPHKVLSTTGACFSGVFTERSQCDFAGMFSERAPPHLVGKAVLLEAKTTKDKSSSSHKTSI